MSDEPPDSELCGGIVLLFGSWARWAALLLSVDMLVALVVVQIKAGADARLNGDSVVSQGPYG